MFNIVVSDTSCPARTGVLEIAGKRVPTPVVWFSHSLKHSLRPWDVAPEIVALINAHEVITHPKAFSSVRDHGIHSYLNFHGLVMMDSGGFQLQQRRNVQIDVEVIAKLYVSAGVEIGVSLDFPLRPGNSSRTHFSHWRCSLASLEQLLKVLKPDRLMPVVHGYSLHSLECACENLRSIMGNVPMVGIGSLVPLMKAARLGANFSYQRGGKKKGDERTFVLDAIRLVRDQFPASFLHVFGLGGTTTILAAFAHGADSVDSTAWRIKAAYGAVQLPGVADRFLSANKKRTRKRREPDAREMRLLALCQCPACSPLPKLTRAQQLGRDWRSRSAHNLWVLMQEVERFKLAIQRNTGREHLKSRLSVTNRLKPILNELHPYGTLR